MKKIVVATVVLNKNDEILLLQRASGKSWGGRWNFPGGKYDSTDKDLMSAAKRETQEEAGITVSDLEFMGKVRYKSFDMYIYSTRTYEGEVKINDESDDFKWVKANELSEYEFPMNGIINWHIYDAIVNLAGDNNE
jgi:8-oxo-dGTP diphosphatase